jgi:hypothetical protein
VRRLDYTTLHYTTPPTITILRPRRKKNHLAPEVSNFYASASIYRAPKKEQKKRRYDSYCTVLYTVLYGKYCTLLLLFFFFFSPSSPTSLAHSSSFVSRLNSPLDRHSPVRLFVYLIIPVLSLFRERPRPSTKESTSTSTPLPVGLPVQSTTRNSKSAIHPPIHPSTKESTTHFHHHPFLPFLSPTTDFPVTCQKEFIPSTHPPARSLAFFGMDFLRCS